MKRLLYIVPELLGGGITVHLFEMIRGMTSKGYIVHIVCITEQYWPNYVKKIIKMGIKVTIIKMSKNIDVKDLVNVEALKQFVDEVIIKINDLVDEFKPDIIHAHGYAIICFSSSQWKNSRKCFYTIHSMHDSIINAAKIWPDIAENTVLIAVSEICASYIEKAINKNPVVIYNGINSSRFKAREHYASDIVKLVNVTRLSIDKNNAFLFEVGRILKEQGIRFQMLLAGRGEVSYENKLKQRVIEMGLEDEILFLGHVDEDDVPDLLQKCDIFVHPSVEAFGMAVVEAMLSGLPVVSINKGAACELINSGWNGFLVEEDAHTFANGVKKLINDPEKRTAIGTRARRKGLLFSIEAMIDRYLQLYNN